MMNSARLSSFGHYWFTDAYGIREFPVAERAKLLAKSLVGPYKVVHWLWLTHCHQRPIYRLTKHSSSREWAFALTNTNFLRFRGLWNVASSKQANIRIDRSDLNISQSGGAGLSTD